MDYMRDASSIVRHMRTFVEQSMTHRQLGFPEQLVLMCLSAHGKCNQESIAAQLRIDRGAITKTIAKLEEKGYVMREVNPASKREKLVEPTELAAEVIAEMSENYKAWRAIAFEGVSSEDLEVALRVISTIAKNTSNEREEA